MSVKQIETAAARTPDDGSLRRYVAAGRRLLDAASCDGCKAAPATLATGNGMGLCDRCSKAQLVERRQSFARLAEARREIAEAMAKR